MWWTEKKSSMNDKAVTTHRSKRLEEEKIGYFFSHLVICVTALTFWVKSILIQSVQIWRCILMIDSSWLRNNFALKYHVDLWKILLCKNIMSSDQWKETMMTIGVTISSNLKIWLNDLCRFWLLSKWLINLPVITY